MTINARKLCINNCNARDYLIHLIRTYIVDVRRKTEKQRTVVHAHELVFAEHVADRVAFFNEGKIAEEGETKKMIYNPENTMTREFMGQIGIK